MEIRLGPVAIASTSRLDAYKAVHKDAALLHQTLWFSDDFEKIRPRIMDEVNALGADLSRLPDPLP